MRKFTVSTRPFDDDMRLYLRKDVEFYPGLTTLVGCNGSGKTTLMQLIKEQLKKDKDALVLSYDDRTDGQSNLMSYFGAMGYTDRLVDMFVSSEGERISRGLGLFAQGLRQKIGKANPKQLWIFMDAVGSGLSIDGILDIKDFVNTVIMDNLGIEVYFVISTNEYEFTIGSDSIDVTTFDHLHFKSYEEYRKFVLKTSKKKERRYKKGDV